MIMIRLFALILALFLPLSLGAALQWDRTSYTAKAGVTDTQTVAEFTFRNTGKSTVTVDEIKTSCGCTTAELDKRSYAPGEGGTIRVVFTFGERIGKQHKTVGILYTENGETAQALLEIFVEIPESVTIDPRIHYWTIGDAPTAKPMNIRFAEGFGGKLVKVTLYSEHSNFIIAGPEQQKDGSYQLSITPKSTAEMDTEAGEIVIEIPGASDPKKYLFYASVRP